MTEAGSADAPAFQIELFSKKLLGPVAENKGVVYTKSWVVELILDLTDFRSCMNLVDRLAIEPAAGDGAFVVAMAHRLVKSCRRQGRPIIDAASSLLAYELDHASAERTCQAVTSALIDEDIQREEANLLAKQWVRTGNYLADAWRLPPADFVVGNPPYIRLEDVAPSELAAYRGAFQTMKGRADIYVAFFEAALRQLKPDGVCAFICADRWMLNQYGGELRRLITTHYGVEAVIEMHNAGAFEEDVDAYPAVTIIRRAKQGPAVVASATAGIERMELTRLSHILEAVRDDKPASLPAGLHAARVETWFRDDDPWPCVSPERLALLKRLEVDFEPLESEKTGTKVGIGVATGLDGVFITKDADLVESSRLLPLATASDTFDGTLRWSGHYLVNPWGPDGLVNLAKYPRLATYFEHNRGRLTERNVARRNPHQWYRTIDRVNHSLLPRQKLYIPDIKGRIHPVLDQGQTYPHHNLYVVHSTGWDHEVLGGLLLSAIAQFFVECYAVRMRGGYLRFQAQYLRRIRVPRPQDIASDQAFALREAFRRRDAQAATDIAMTLYGIDTLPSETNHGNH